MVIIKTPEAAAEALTMFAALLFLTGGVFRLVGSLVVRGPQFGWTLVQGAFGLLLGILVLATWPSSSQYVIGTFFSLSLLFDGLGLIRFWFDVDKSGHIGNSFCNGVIRAATCSTEGDTNRRSRHFARCDLMFS